MGKGGLTMSKADKMNKYYIAYCAEEKNKRFSFGDVVIANKNKLKMSTEKDIETVKEFIIKKAEEYNNVNIKNITIMDFRKLE